MSRLLSVSVKNPGLIDFGSKDSLPKIKDGAYVINLIDKKS